jgi:arylsulfatase A-like enzyme
MKTSPNLIISSLTMLSLSITTHSQTKPNYLIILADDLGYGDLSCHGGKTPTPNIDKLFNQSVEFENFMTCPVSSPTRAGLLTGLNPLRIGQGPNTDGQLDTSIPNLGSIFKNKGYKTGLFGKWHNGNVPEFYPTLPHVNDYGFDKFVGFYGGGLDYYTKVWQNKPTSPDWYNDKTEINNNLEYATDVLTRSTIDFMEQNKGGQFLAYLPFNIIHSPLHVRDVDLQRVPNSIIQAAGGTIRTWKEYYKLYNDVEVPAFNTMYAQLTGDNSIFDITGTLTTAERQILYSAMLISLDDKVGELMKYLDDNNLANNTVVLFFSDNGATPDGNPLPFSGNKHSTLEGGVHAPALIRWPAGGLVGPKKFKPMVGYLDVLPTFMEMSGISPASIGQIDGSSFLNELKTDAQSGNRAYYWLWRDHDVIRTDNWKLNRYIDYNELFAIQTDITESSNVASGNPEVVNNLLAKLETWRESTGVAITHLAPKLSAPVNPSPDAVVLKLTADVVVNATNPEPNIQISGTGYKLLPDDYLHFDIKTETGNQADGFYISPLYNANKYFTSKRGVDQFGRVQSGGPATRGGAGVWEHRVIGLGNEAPGTINKFSIILKKTGKYIIYIDNIQIRRGDGTVIDVWSNSTRVNAQTPLYTISSGTGYKLEASWQQSYSLTVNGGTGSGTYLSGVPVAIKANAPQGGLAFDKWVVNSGTPIIASIYDANTTVANSNNSVITATYGNAGPHALMVNNGTGSGLFTAGTEVRITADTAPAGQVFNRWIINSGTPVIADIYNPSTSLKSPTNAASVTATYINYLDACDATTGWNATTTLNTTDIKEGTGSLQYVGSGTPEFSKVFEPFNPNIPAANAALKFWYYVSDVTKFATANQVELGSGGKNDVAEYNWTLTGLVNGWNYIQLKISSASTSGGTPNFEAINWFRIYHSKTGEMTTKVDAIEISGITNQTSPTAIREINNDEKSFQIYPNPLSNGSVLTIKVKNAGVSTIKIMNLNGQVVYSDYLDGATYHYLPLNRILNSGLYLVSLSSNETKVTQKLVVK